MRLHVHRVGQLKHIHRRHDAPEQRHRHVIIQSAHMAIPTHDRIFPHSSNKILTSNPTSPKKRQYPWCSPVYCIYCYRCCCLSSFS